MQASDTPSLHHSTTPVPAVNLARNAMATRFELVLHGEDSVALRAAGEEALEEIERLENQFSLYRPGSEIAQLNARAARESVRVTPEVFALLQHAQHLHAETDGAFDITIAPLIRAWGFMHNAGRKPSEDELAAALACVGMNLVRLDTAKFTVRFAREGVMLDLGAIGKGYAIERAAGILREAGVKSALLHGGTSTVCAIGHQADGESWCIAIERPRLTDLPFPELPDIRLADESLSVSAISGRSFKADGKWYGHVVDPRTGLPVESAVLSAVVLPSATETDALSTGLLVQGRKALDALAVRRSARCVILDRSTGQRTQFAQAGFDEFTGKEPATGNNPVAKARERD